MNRVRIVGAGLAGLSAAITLAEAGVACDLISVQPSERAQSVMAEGGINAALDTMGEHDSMELHFEETMAGGCDLADPNAVWNLVCAAPNVIDWLRNLGAPFQMQNGKLLLRSFGGQKKKRTAFAKSSTGKVLMTALVDEARKWEAQGLIRRLPHHCFLDLITDGGDCCGVRVQDQFTGSIGTLPGSVILACGGMNALFSGLTTGSAANTGDVTGTVFAQGVTLANLEFIQYHPTTAAISGKRLLISEAARGEGGRLFIECGGQPWYFMEERYPELGNLMPRDVVSREMVRVKNDPSCGDQVFLDMTGLDGAVWAEKLSDLREECVRLLGCDPMTTPVAVAPGIHYFMGGIAVDTKHRTSMRHLYAAGECACQYHGANRLGGNSMLGAIVGGKTAAQTMLTEPFDVSQTEHWTAGEAPALAARLSAAPELTAVLSRALGIFRNGETLTDALQILEHMTVGADDMHRLLLAKVTVISALERKESRGAHQRTDYPNRDDAAFRKTSLVRVKHGRIEHEFCALPQKRSADT